MNCGTPNRLPLPGFIEFGRSTARTVGEAAQHVGNLFLRLLQMVAVPLIITSLICGITGLGDAASLGGMFLRTILYYVCTSAAAITIGLVAVNILQAWHHRQLLPHLLTAARNRWSVS